MAKVSRLFYSPAHLREWCNREYRFLTDSAASHEIKEILLVKVTRRGGNRRFFGEAYVAATTTHRLGYYSSFKWLTNPRFLSEAPFPVGPAKMFQERLREALHQHFGQDQLKRLQMLASHHHQLTGVRPVAPDLWLIDRRWNHRFIEVKLPRDRVHERQLIGMDLIASCLRAKGRVDVEVMELCAKNTS